LTAFSLSCESKQKTEVAKTAEPQQAVGQVVDASKQTPLQGPFQKEQGNCWTAALQQHTAAADNSKESSRSKLVMYEDGKPLGPGHAMHDEIRTKGGGKYSHWNDTLYFSTSDNSDPNKNGKKYTFSL
jgi:hypothetical protein